MSWKSLHVHREDAAEVRLEYRRPGGWKMDGEPISFDAQWLDASAMHIILEDKNYHIERLESARSGWIKLSVNHQIFEFKVQTDLQVRLAQLGFQSAGKAVIKELKAPMPGLVMKILTEVGQIVKKGEPLMVLEAMKMENVLKAPTDGTVKNIRVQQGQALEKNEVLIVFE